MDTGDKTRMTRIGRNRTLLTNPKISRYQPNIEDYSHCKSIRDFNSLINIM